MPAQAEGCAAAKLTHNKCLLGRMMPGQQGGPTASALWTRRVLAALDALQKTPARTERCAVIKLSSACGGPQCCASGRVPQTVAARAKCAKGLLGYSVMQCCHSKILAIHHVHKPLGCSVATASACWCIVVHCCWQECSSTSARCGTLRGGATRLSCEDAPGNTALRSAPAPPLGTGGHGGTVPTCRQQQHLQSVLQPHSVLATFWGS